MEFPIEQDVKIDESSKRFYQNKKQNGVGIESIKNIVESANGIALFDVNEEKNMFRFYIKIPLSHE